MPFIQLLGEDVDLQEAICKFCRQQGYGFSHHREAQDLLESHSQGRPSLIMITPPRDGRWNVVQAVGDIRISTRHTPLIVINDQSSENQVLTAFKLGVSDYFTYPVALSEVLARVESLASEPARQSVRDAATNDPHPAETGTLMGNSPPMQQLERQLRNIATCDSTVLITGETGTGKDLVAHLIHQGSRRRHKPMICLNCAAVPDSLLEGELFGFEKGAFTGAHASFEGKLRLAEGGTFFFDEIGDMSPGAQAKLLQVVETKEVYRLRGRQPVALDIRIIAATNQDLEKLRAAGRFRSDLYYRLEVVNIALPPLRDRKEDIPLLLEHFIRHFNGIFGREVQGCTQEALDLLLSYDWPGNVRELRNFCEASFINLSSSYITSADFPRHFRKKAEAQGRTAASEKDLLLTTLLANNWNITDSARQLHWSRTTLYRKLAKFNLQASKVKKPSLQEDVTQWTNV